MKWRILDNTRIPLKHQATFKTYKVEESMNYPRLIVVCLTMDDSGKDSQPIKVDPPFKDLKTALEDLCLLPKTLGEQAIPHIETVVMYNLFGESPRGITGLTESNDPIFKYGIAIFTFQALILFPDCWIMWNLV